MNWPDLTIELPLPPSSNDLVRPALVRGKVRLVSTGQADVFRLIAVTILQALAAKHRHPARLTGPVQISAQFFVQTLASDCNNRWKSLEDAITASAVVWNDDKQVAEGVSWKDFCGTSAPFCRVRVSPVVNDELGRRLAEASRRKPRQTPKVAADPGLRATPNYKPPRSR